MSSSYKTIQNSSYEVDLSSDNLIISDSLRSTLSEQFLRETEVSELSKAPVHMISSDSEYIGELVSFELHSDHTIIDFKMRDKPATPLSTLLMARNIALNYGLKYVYCGNVHDIESDTTYCPYCHSRLIERDWYQLKQYALNGTGHCLNCDYLLPYVVN